MKAAFHTLGCKTNAYETQAIIEQFQNAGFEIVPFSERADVYLINTCSVTAVAAQKSRQMLHRCKKLSPDSLVVACGCYAQESAEGLLADGGVDLVVGNNEKSKVLELVEQALSESSSGKILVDDLTHCSAYEPQTITNAGSHVRAYVKIQDGCNRFCSYCIIPFLRGRSRSRAPEEILEEIRILADSGIKEIVLTGIDISDYQSPEGETDLAGLILEAEKIEGIERIRLGSLEAGIITDAFLEKICESKTFCPHFHLSLQSGCDETLRRMNRHYTSGEFLETVKKLRSIFPDAAVTTDVIAGFAGETEEEFSVTKEFVQKAAFSQMHVFPYSRRKGTKADRMPGQLSKAQKSARAAELIRIGEEMQQEYMKRFLGTPVQILTEEVIRIDGEEYLTGYTPQYVKAAVRGGRENINTILTLTPEKIIVHQKEFLLLE